MKKLLTLTLGIFLISCISAINLIPEEPYSFDLGDSYSYYEITGNSSEVNLNISQTGNIVTIIPDKYMKESNFTITFYGEKDEVISSSGGSSGGLSGSSVRVIPASKIHEGYEKKLYKNQKIFFKLNNSNHYLQLRNIGNNSAEFLLRSDEYIFNLSEKQCKKFNLEEELFVCLLSLDSKAEVRIQSNVDVKPEKETEQKENETEIKEEPEEEVEEKEILNYITIILLGLAGVGVVWSLGRLLSELKSKKRDSDFYISEK